MAHVRVNSFLQKRKVTSLLSKFVVPYQLFRNNSTLTKNTSVHKNESKISKSVFISQSNDIFTNLALEDWIFKNFDFINHHILLLWMNSPCVVIGRNQNPWLEANLGPLADKGIQLARRNSGGGTVYHDHGNLNLSFFTPVERYNRKLNLEIIRSALHREWKLNSEINKKEDIVVNGVYKISGTASRLARPNSYHHCTLLVDANKKILSEALHRYDKGIETKATVSIPSPVVNLSEVNSAISVQRLVNAIGWEYLRSTALTNQDGGWELVAKQRGFQMINPTDEWFPGLEKIRRNFESWDWRYGWTPEFTITRSFPLPQHISISNGTTQEEELQVTVTVTKGLVENIVMKIPPSLKVSNEFIENVKVMSNIKGRRFTEDALLDLNTSFGESLDDDNRHFVADCVRKVMASV